MSKPQWLKDKEQQVRRVEHVPDLCCDCIYFGKHVKHVKHKNAEWVDLHECDIHFKCFNTKYSICCDDFTREELV